MRSPGESDGAGRVMSSGPRANFASSVRASVAGSADRPAKSSMRTPANRSRAWVNSPKTTAGPTRREPRASGSSPVSARISVVLPVPFAPTTARRSLNWSPSSTGAERERADLHDRAHQFDDRSGGRRRGELHLQPPRRPRLLDLFEPLQVVTSLIDLAAQGVRRAPVGAAGLTRQLALASQRVRLAAPVLEQRRVPALLADVVGIGGLVLGARPRTRRLVLRPRAAVLVDAPRLGFDLHDAIDRPVEEVIRAIDRK